MFKKKIKYVDFNGAEREEDFYFHMSVPEATRLEARFGGMSLETYAKNLALNQNMEPMIKFIEDIILSSYGQKSSDGRSFIKNDRIREEFEYSQAYAELFEEMLTNPEVAEAFAKGVAAQTKQFAPPK